MPVKGITFTGIFFVFIRKKSKIFSYFFEKQQHDRSKKTIFKYF